MNRSMSTFFTCITVLFSFIAAETHTVVFQQGVDNYTGCDDSELRNPLQHYENGPEPDILKVSEHCPACPISRIAIKFDLSSIPADATITSASLELFADFYDGGAMTGVYSVFQIAQQWNPAKADWEHTSRDLVWGNPGGDFIGTPVARITWPRSNEYVWVPFNVLPLVKEYVSTPSLNYGFLIINTDGAQAIDFIASEHAATELHPKLNITYESAGITTAKQLRNATPAYLAIRATAPGSLTIHNRSLQRSNIAITRANGVYIRQISLPPGATSTVHGLGTGIFIVSENGHSSTVTLYQ